MNLEDLKLRQLYNQHLITKADKTTVVKDLCGLQAQFMANAIHALKIRTNDFDEATVGEGLVKNWTLRGTVHVFAESDLPLFLHCNNGADYRSNDWGGKRFWNQRDCWALTPERQAYFSGIIMAAIEETPKSRDELKEICRNAGMTQPEEDSMFDQWGGGIRELCERGFANYTVCEKKLYCPAPPFSPIPTAAAELELARRYFTHFAPATIHDAMYFFRATAAKVKAWLAALPVSATECGGKTYYYIENKQDLPEDMPEVCFLAGFDQLMLGYEKKESLYLPAEHLRKIFNLAGIVMPAILYCGKVIGRWKKKNRNLTAELFAEPNAAVKTAITAEAESLWDDLNKLTIGVF